MTDTPADMPTTCPHHGGKYGKGWLYDNRVDDYKFYTCETKLDDGSTYCHWAINFYTPESDSFARSEIWVVKWNTMFHPPVTP